MESNLLRFKIGRKFLYKGIHNPYLAFNVELVVSEVTVDQVLLYDKGYIRFVFREDPINYLWSTSLLKEQYEWEDL